MYTQLLPQGAPKVLAVKLSVIGERSVRSNHPWIFTDSIEKINKEGISGDIAIIFSHSKNKERSRCFSFKNPTCGITLYFIS